ncbi:MAG TPA: hypothetical protein VMR95_02515 [Candidatus Binatia bacterium]|nr:hypothetical protein [Candidatus Binatia bacterium]
MSVASNSKTKVFVRLLSPSATGLVLYAIVAFLITVVQVIYLSSKLNNLQQGVRSTFHLFGSWFINLVGSNRVNSLAIYIFWLAAGVVVWFILKAAASNVNELIDDLNLRKYIWPKQAEHNRPLIGFIEHSLFRLAILIVLLFYIQRVVGNLFGLFTNGSPHISWINNHIAVEAAFIFLSWVVVLHGFVILLRLIALKTRLFSGGLS